jgi:hypothetical protein
MRNMTNPPPRCVYDGQHLLGFLRTVKAGVRAELANGTGLGSYATDRDAAAAIMRSVAAAAPVSLPERDAVDAMGSRKRVSVGR